MPPLILTVDPWLEHVDLAGLLPEFELEQRTLPTADPATGNMLIQGDNLDALNDLLPLHAGRLNFSFIGPRSTTRSAFEPYDHDCAA